MTARFLNPAALVKTIPLQHPLEFAGKVYTEVSIKRLTAGEMAAFAKTFEETRKANPDISFKPPIFVDSAGDPLSDAFLDALECDDFDHIDEEAVAFLPRRFRRVVDAVKPDQNASIPNTGEHIEPGSEASSVGQWRT